MWQSGDSQMEEVQERGMFPVDKLDILDINIRTPALKNGGVPVAVETEPMSSMEHYNDAIQTFGLAPKVSLVNESVGLHQSFDVKKLEAISHPMVQRQESDEIIDRRRQAKRVAPPEVDIQETADPSCVSHLGVTRKIAHKRIRVNEDKVEESYKKLQKDINDLNFGYKEPPKPAQPCQDLQKRIQAEQKIRAALKLIEDVNKAGIAGRPETVPSGKVMFDEGLDWQDLDSPREKTLVGCGTFGTVLRLKTHENRRLIRKILEPKQQAGIHPNEIQVPLRFSDCATITSVLGVSWDGQNMSVYQEYAGKSFRDLMQIPEHRKFLQERYNTWRVLREVFEAFNTLHMHGIRHRDVKPENMCYDPETGQVRLIDFASSRTPQDPEERSLCGTTPEYLPPLVSYCIKYKYKPPPLMEKSDVWGAGMLALYLVKGGHPVIMFFTNKPEYPASEEAPKIRNAVLAKFAEFAKHGDSLPPWFVDHKDDPDMETLLRGCLSLDEAKRWTSQQALNFIKAKLSREELATKVRKLKSAPPVHTGYPGTNLSKAVDNWEFGQNLNIRQGKLESPLPTSNQTYGTPVSPVTGFVLKRPVLGASSTIHHQLPPGAQLVTAMTTVTPPSRPLPTPAVRPRQQSVLQITEMDVDADDADLAWVRNNFTAMKPTPPAPQLANPSCGQAKKAVTLHPGIQHTPGFKQDWYNKSRKVLPPEQSARCTGKSSTPLAASQVVGLWGKIKPQQPQPEVTGRSQRNVMQEPQGNIPNFLNEAGDF